MNKNYVGIARNYTCSRLLDQCTKTKVTEMLILSKSIIQWKKYIQQRKMIRSGLHQWKTNVFKRSAIRTKYNLLFVMLIIVIKWKHYVKGRVILRSVVSLMEGSICSICYSTTPNFISRCKHTFCKKCISRWLKLKNTCAMCRSSEIMNDVEDDIDDGFDFLQLQ